MTALIVGALAIVAFLLFCVVVALGGALLAISAAEPPSPWDEPAANESNAGSYEEYQHIKRNAEIKQ